MKQCRKKIAASFSVLLLCLALLGAWYLVSYPRPVSQTQITSASEQSPLPSEESSTCKTPQLMLSSQDLRSQYVLLKNIDTNETLYEKHSSEFCYPASLTKLMTAVVAVEANADLASKFRVKAEYFPVLYAAEASLAGFYKDETASLQDLLYGCLLASGADCTATIANGIAGSESAFALLMNQKAASLDMTQTHFTNASGLHDPNHISSVHDLAILLEYVLKNDTLKQIISTESYRTTQASMHPDGLVLKNTLFRRMENIEESLHNGTILGGKTGYTEQAGQCLASYAQIEGQTYLLITTGAESESGVTPYAVADAITVYGAIETPAV